MNRHVLSLLVDNHAGVLSRIVGLFSRRGYNIDSLSVGVTEHPTYSRITIVVLGDDRIIEQITRQVDKLVDVIKVIELKNSESVYRELALIKVSVPPSKRTEIVGIADIFRANIVDVSPSSLMVELTGDQSKITAFMELVEPYGIIEMSRTGLTGLMRGAAGIREDLA